MAAKLLKHRFVSAISDGTDTTLVRPTNWNDDHNLWLGGRTVAGTSDTLADADHLSLVKYNNAGAIAVTLPAPTVSTFLTGWVCFIRDVGLGTVTITPSGGATINGGASIQVASTQGAIIFSDGTNYDAIITGPAPLFSPAFTGVPTAPTAALADNSTTLATTAFVKGQAYAPLASPAFTGTPTAPTATVGDSSTTLATTAFVQGAAGGASIRYDISQSLTSAQQGLASRNIGASSAYLINGKIVETHASNAATFFLKTLAGSDPSASDPVQVWLPDGSIFTITAALSIVLASGSTFALANAIAFRLWFVIINDGGTARLGVRNSAFCSTTAPWNYNFFAPKPFGVISSSNAAMTNYGTTYTNTVNVSDKPYRVIAFADYDSGLATSGNYNVSPTRIVLVSGDTPQSGAVVSEWIYETNVQTTAASTTAVQSSIANTIAPWGLCNYLDVSATFDVYCVDSAVFCSGQFRRGGTSIGLSGQWGGISSSGGSVVGGGMFGGSLHTVLRVPTLSAQVYAVFFGNTTGSATVYLPVTEGCLVVREIMG